MGGESVARINQSAGVCLAAVMAAVALPVCAQSTDGVEIVVSALVTERCGFTSGPPLALNAAADLEDAHSQSLALRVDCNTPFSVSARSEGGRLTNRSASDDRSGYAFNKVYGLSLEVGTDVGVIRSGRCLSTALVDGGDCVLAQPGGLVSGAGVSIGGDATVTVDWPSQSLSQRRLAAGDYSDTVTISIAAHA
jgi:spore coat protein U-like protein